jgi:hypothetical protein
MRVFLVLASVHTVLVGLFPPEAPTIKSESAAISQYPNLSTFHVPAESRPGAAGYLPNEQRLISARSPQNSRTIELNDASD